MLTKSDLEQIGEVVDKKVAARTTPLEKGLDNVNKRLDGMDTRFDHVDKRLSGIDTRFDHVDKRLSGIEKLQKRHSRDIKQKLNMIIDYFEKEWVRVQKRIDQIQSHLRI